MKYYYFVSYVCQDISNIGMAYGNYYFTSSTKIRTKEEGDLIIKSIEENSGVSKITLMNITLLDSEESSKNNFYN